MTSNCASTVQMREESGSGIRKREVTSIHDSGRRRVLKSSGNMLHFIQGLKSVG